MITQAEVTRWAAVHVGPGPVVVGPRVGDNTCVFRVSGPRGRVVVKSHATQRSFEQEHDALRNWGPHLPFRVPTVLDADEAARILVLSHLVGSEAPFSAEAYVAAGAALAALHGLVVHDQDPVSPTQALLTRREQALLRSASALGPAREARVRATLEHCPIPAGPRVACHRDFTPRNWLWDREQGLAVLDFEHARLDHPVTDWARLLAETPASSHHALSQGYGSAPAPEAAVRGASITHWLNTLAWCAARGRTRDVAVAFRALDTLTDVSPDT